MKQIIQSLKTGEIEVADVAAPMVRSGFALIHSKCSLISTGTEKMLVDFGRANFINKIQQQPDKVRMVIDKIKTDGIFPTYESVKNKLDQPISMGYCNVGKIISLGTPSDKFKIGDRVVSNSKHADIVLSSYNLCAKIPDEVSDEAASFTVLGAIALQGVRLAAPTIGENFVVIGLGLIGLLTIQILRANGCNVIGIDFNQRRLDLASNFGAEVFNLSDQGSPLNYVMKFTKGLGADAVIIAASTISNEPVQQAASMLRKKGKIVLVGTSGLNLSRADFYEKEISFQVSCSYGPGRYDKNYEELGQDYPIAYVRWTVQRNFEAILDLLKNKSLKTELLISHRFDINEAKSAYQLFQERNQPLGIILKYNSLFDTSSLHTQKSGFIPKNLKNNNFEKNNIINFIGSGNYALSTLIPNFKIHNVIFGTVVSSGGVSGWHAAKKFGFKYSSTDPNNAINDPDANIIVVATRHNTHSQYVVSSLAAGKNVFVEKPLALNQNELDSIESIYCSLNEDARPILTVGFNRRFSPHILKIKELLSSSIEPIALSTTINAGLIDSNNWNHDLSVGGGRVIGEVCHFIDLLRFLASSEIESSDQKFMSSIHSDTLTIQLRFKNGSIGNINYFANGTKSFPKERLEVFSSGRVLLLDNFKVLTGYGWPKFKKYALWKQDKGQKNCVEAFLKAASGLAPPPIPFHELLEVAKITIKISQNLR